MAIHFGSANLLLVSYNANFHLYTSTQHGMCKTFSCYPTCHIYIYNQSLNGKYYAQMFRHDLWAVIEINKMLHNIVQQMVLKLKIAVNAQKLRRKQKVQQFWQTINYIRIKCQWKNLLNSVLYWRNGQNYISSIVYCFHI